MKKETVTLISSLLSLMLLSGVYVCWRCYGQLEAVRTAAVREELDRLQPGLSDELRVNVKGREAYLSGPIPAALAKLLKSYAARINSGDPRGSGILLSRLNLEAVVIREEPPRAEEVSPRITISMMKVGAMKSPEVAAENGDKRKPPPKVISTTQPPTPTLVAVSAPKPAAAPPAPTQLAPGEVVLRPLAAFDWPGAPQALPAGYAGIHLTFRNGSSCKLEGVVASENEISATLEKVQSILPNGMLLDYKLVAGAPTAVPALWQQIRAVVPLFIEKTHAGSLAWIQGHILLRGRVFDHTTRKQLVQELQRMLPNLLITDQLTSPEAP